MTGRRKLTLPSLKLHVSLRGEEKNTERQKNTKWKYVINMADDVNVNVEGRVKKLR